MSNQGKIVQIIGAVVDVEFPREAVPNVYDALKVDGITGENTWNALFNAADVVNAQCTPRPTPVPTVVPYYVVVDVKFAPLFDACLREYLTMAHDQQVTDIFGNTYCREFQPIDPTAWGADRAWQLYSREEALTEYLLVYGNRIVNFDFSLEPNQEQKDIVKARFG